MHFVREIAYPIARHRTAQVRGDNFVRTPFFGSVPALSSTLLYYTARQALRLFLGRVQKQPLYKQTHEFVTATGGYSMGTRHSVCGSSGAGLVVETRNNEKRYIILSGEDDVPRHRNVSTQQ